jgi:hypothetical protein
MVEMIQEMVDEYFDIEGPIEIGNLTFNRSYIVRELDPTAYRQAMVDMADSLIEDLQYDLERLDPEVDAEEIAEMKERIEALENI